jgi:hypothetical protein
MLPPEAAIRCRHWTTRLRCGTQWLVWSPMYTRDDFTPGLLQDFAPLMNLQLRAIETTNIEQRLTKLEKRLAEADGELDDNTQGPVLE